mmetsp:Transcript_7910/g.11908  ORF Transcript_7910/g.11908 Transcript_7910/m.11908 type:complete len:464 (+) Transcript_7910:45-1436(+)
MENTPFFLDSKTAETLDKKKIKDAVDSVFGFCGEIERATKYGGKSLINSSMQRYVQSLRSKAERSLKAWDGKSKTSLMTEIYFLLSILEENTTGLVGFEKTTVDVSQKAIAKAAFAKLAPLLNKLWPKVVGAFSPKERSKQHLESKTRMMRMMARHFTQKARTKHQENTEVKPKEIDAKRNQTLRIVQMPDIPKVSREDVRKTHAQYVQGIQALGIEPEHNSESKPYTAQTLISLGKLVVEHYIGALAVVLAKGRDQYYVATLHGIAIAVGDLAMDLSKKGHALYKLLIEADLINVSLARLESIQSDLGTEGINYYEVLALMSIVLNSTCGRKPKELDDLRKKAFQNLENSDVVECFHRELYSPYPDVHKLAKKAISSIFQDTADGKEAEEKFEAGLHRMQLRRCANPECRKLETKKNQFRKCGSCRRVVYCSTACQKNHWKQHKAGCKCIARLIVKSKIVNI